MVAIRNSLTKGAKSLQLAMASLAWGSQALLLVTAVCVFVPFSPAMPSAGLDPSWIFGINQAVAQHLAFGRDIIFTFGPYASIYTKTYHPATDHLMLFGGLYLAISYWVALFLISKNRPWYFTFAFASMLASVMYSRDALLFSYPLIVGIVCFELINLHRELNNDDKLALVKVIILFLPFGLLPLIKGTILVLCGTIVLLVLMLFVIHKKKHLAIAAVVAPIISISIFWIASGQSIYDIPNYFISMLPIISGYSEAMASNGEKLEVVSYLVATVILLLSVLQERRFEFKLRIFLFSVFFVFLFLAFKAGFVRHDGHALMSGTSLLIAVLLLSIIQRSRYAVVALVVVICASVYIDRHYVKMSPNEISRNISSTYSSAWFGIKNRLTKKNWLTKDFDSALRGLKEQANFPVLPGTTDIYSYNQSFLIASGNQWNPRPILQSYSAYTSSLAEKDKAHLLGSTAPDNVIFRVEPIDQRLPSLEDGASWPTLLTRYKPTELDNGFLYLGKRAIVQQPKLLPIAHGTYDFGEVVRIPAAAVPIFATVFISPSFFGRLANIFFKPDQLEISLNLTNGTSRTYRFIPEMAKSGFLISPLIENTFEFGLLYGRTGYLAGQTVKSFSIMSLGSRRLWKMQYGVVFKKLVFSPTNDIASLYKFDGVVTEADANRVSVAGKCDGSVDSIDGISPPPAKATASGLLSVSGWLAKSADKGILPKSVLLVLTDSNNKQIFFKTRRTSRPDVGGFFKSPALDASGYTSMANVSMLQGDYTVGLAYTEGDHIELCPQFKNPVVIRKISYVQ